MVSLLVRQAVREPQAAARPGGVNPDVNRAKAVFMSRLLPTTACNDTVMVSGVSHCGSYRRQFTGVGASADFAARSFDQVKLAERPS